MVQPKKGYVQNFGTKGSYLDSDTAVKVVPAPVGGWDAISPQAAMEPKYANILTNWTPRPGWIELRGGYNPWCQNLSGSGNPVNSLLTYRPNILANEQLFAASNTQLFNVSIYGAPVAIPQVTLTVDKLQWVNFTPAQGSNYLVFCNGTDPVYEFDGTNWTQPAITGVSPNQLIQVNVFKRRLWFVQANSTSVWFLGTDAITGPATQLDIGALMDRGGKLLAMATWTVDGGSGPDDYAVFITTRGQLIVYKGTDPTNANAWSLVAVFNVSIPIGTRCFIRYGSDVLLITQEGVLPLSQALPFDPVASRNVAVTNRIQNAFIQASQLYNTNFGWEAIAYAPQNLIIVNIPQVVNAVSVQYVMNALTGAWTQFTGWNANTFGIFNNNLYFADSSGNVNLAYAGGLDKNLPILADVRCAFNYFEEPGRLKKATMVRPFIVADGTVTPTIEIDADFAISSFAAPVTTLVPTGGIWDTSLWDSGIWSTGSTTTINWLGAQALGTALAVRMQINLGSGGATTAAAQSSVFDTGVFDMMVFDGNGVIIGSGLGIPTLQVQQFELALKYGGPI